MLCVGLKCAWKSQRKILDDIAAASRILINVDAKLEICEELQRRGISELSELSSQ